MEIVLEVCITHKGLKVVLKHLQAVFQGLMKTHIHFHCVSYAEMTSQLVSYHLPTLLSVCVFLINKQVMTSRRL